MSASSELNSPNQTIKKAVPGNQERPLTGSEGRPVTHNKQPAVKLDADTITDCATLERSRWPVGAGCRLDGDTVLQALCRRCI